jgi:glycosyltransferase involved in cell wall biosynthesis
MKQKGLLHKMFSMLEAWITNRADYVVTSSTPTAELLRKEFPEIEDRLTPLIDAVDTDLFLPLPKDMGLLEELGIPADKRLIVYLGAMTEYQGVDLLLDSLVRLSKERDDFHALLMGYPEDEYIQKAKHLKLSGRVTFTGKLKYSDALRYLNLGDIAVSPKLSATEANGKLLNYMASGLPTIATDSPVNRELLGDSGMYMQSTTSSELSRCIAELLSDEERQDKLTEKARHSAVHNHSWATRILALERVYVDLLR